MSSPPNPFAGTPYEQWASDFVASFRGVIEGDDVLTEDAPVLAEADELARKLEDQ